MDDPCKVLGLAPGPSREEVERAYRTLARRYPPEWNPERFARLHRAYEMLRSLGRTMEEAWREPEEALALLAAAAAPVLRHDEPPARSLRPDDLEPLLRSLRQAALARLLRESFGEEAPGSR